MRFSFLLFQPKYEHNKLIEVPTIDMKSGYYFLYVYTSFGNSPICVSSKIDDPTLKPLCLNFVF